MSCLTKIDDDVLSYVIPAIYRVGQKKLHTVFMAITLSTLNHFS